MHSDTLPTPTPAEAVAEASARIPPDAAMLTVDQVAALLQLDRRTVERKVSAGAIPGSTKVLGRTRRFVRATIEAWIANGCPPFKAEWRKGRSAR